MIKAYDETSTRTIVNTTLIPAAEASQAGGNADSIVTVTGASLVIGPEHAGKYIRFTGTGAKTAVFTGDEFPVGAVIEVRNAASSGNVTMSGASGFTLTNGIDGSAVLAPAASVRVRIVAADEGESNGNNQLNA